MSNVSLNTAMIFLNLLVGCIAYLTGIFSAKLSAIYALMTMGLIAFVTLKRDSHRLTYSSALLLYTVATQFGLVIPCLLFGRGVVGNYSDYTLRFLDNLYLAPAIILGVIATTSYELGVQFSKENDFSAVLLKNSVKIIDDNSERRMYLVGILSLSAVLLFFAYHIFSGGTKLFSTYEMYRESSACTSSIYSYILILFYVGTIYLASAGEILQHKLGWFLWLLLVVVFALNGNKGEFLYATLAVLGMKGTEGKKISGKIVVVVLLLVFLVIPSITALRGIGVADNLSQISFNPFDAFTEMGMQIRTSVYGIEDITTGKYEYLYGRSYWQPIFNILTPFFSHSQATALMKEDYWGYGFSQVIESFINFDILGTIVYFFLVGLFLGKVENKPMSKCQLAYLGTVTCILINATRNYFAFVPGQVLMVSMIYFICKRDFIRKGALR